jgi:hypothetical protein
MDVSNKESAPQPDRPRDGERQPISDSTSERDEPSIVVEGVRGERALVTGAGAVFDLVRQANAALADNDPRKITAGWLVRVEAIRDMIVDLSAFDDSEWGAARRQLARGWEEMAMVLRSIVESTEQNVDQLDDV